MVVAAARHAEHLADRAERVSGGTLNLVDHGAESGRGLVPRMTAAFFKMSFSILRRASSRRIARSSSAASRAPPACGPSLPPGVEEIVADAEALRELGDRLAGLKQCDGLGFEFGGVARRGGSDS